MTIQVGMVGTDGVLIAGDTQWTAMPKLIDTYWAAGRHGYNASKIKVNHTRGIAISCAMDMGTACAIADKIMVELKDENFAFPEAIVQEIAMSVYLRTSEKRQAHCLIALPRPQPQLFLFQFVTDGEQWSPQCERMHSKAFCGDTVNAAIFWGEHYYKKLPVEQMSPLAAHLVVCAGKRNTAMISGLEIVFCTTSGCRRLSDDSIRDLQTKAEEWDKSFGEVLLNHRQQFTYAPNVIG